MATNIGVGCTTISILLANTLAHEGKRAAIVELDDADGCFEQLCRQEREEEQVDGITKFANRNAGLHITMFHSRNSSWTISPYMIYCL